MSTERIIKVQQLSHFAYRVYDILDADTDVTILPVEINNDHRSYAQIYDPGNPTMVKLWRDLGFNPNIEYIKINFANENTEKYLSSVKMGHAYHSNVTLPVNFNRSSLGHEQDYSECYINQSKKQGGAPQAFSVIEKNYINNSMIRVFKEIGEEYIIMMPILTHHFLVHLSQYKKNEIVRDFLVDEFLQGFFHKIKLADKDLTLVKIIDTYLPFLFSLSALDDICFEECYDNIYPKYKPSLENWYQHITHQGISDQVHGPRKGLVCDVLDKHQRYCQEIKDKSKILQDSVYTLRDVCSRFLEKEKDLYQHLNIPHHTD